MIERKTRPVNGPGANNLRGGLHEYSTKTTIRDWVEATGGPKSFQRGFTTEEFMSETQCQQLGLNKLKIYGAELPNDHMLLRSFNKDNNNDIFHPPSGPSSSSWLTTTQAMSKNLDPKYKEEYNPQLSDDRLREIAEYRARWTEEREGWSKIRFRTDFEKDSHLRKLPGTPIALEKLRDYLIEHQGILGLSAIRSAVGKGIISVDDFNTSLEKIGMEMPRADYNSIVRYFTTNNVINVETFMTKIIHASGDFNKTKAYELFNLLFRRTRVSVEDVQNSVSTNYLSSKLIDALLSYIPVYAADDGTLGKEEFARLLEDMYESTPQAMDNLLPKIFES